MKELYICIIAYLGKIVNIPSVILLGWSMYAVLFFILGALMLAASFFSLSLHGSRKE